MNFQILKDRKALEKFLLIVIGALILTIFEVTFVFRQQFASLAAANKTITGLQQELKEANRSISEAQKLESRKKEMSDKVAYWESNMHSESESGFLLSFLSRKAQEAGVRIEGIVPPSTKGAQEGQAAKNPYAVLERHVRVRSGYHEFSTFINLLETSELPIIVEKIGIMGNPDDPKLHVSSAVIHSCCFKATGER